MDALIKALEVKGLKVMVKVEEKEISRGYYDPYNRRQVPPTTSIKNTPQVHVQGEVLTFSIEERSKRQLRSQPSTSRKWPAYSDKSGEYDLVPNGILHFHIEGDGYFHKRHWNDGKRTRLEDQLGVIVSEFEVVAEEIKQRRRESDEEAKRYAEAEARRKEPLRQEEIEKNRRVQFFAELSRWRFVEDAQRMIAAVKARAEDNSEAMTEETAKWLSWAEGLIARLDPLSGGLPELCDYDRKLPPEATQYFNPYARPTEQDFDRPFRYPFWLRKKG